MLFCTSFFNFWTAVSSLNTRSNPCLFPAAYFPELAALEGDRGGKRVIRAHPEAVLTVPLPEKELFDTDTKEDLSRLKEI